jgi:hypothetical protein
VTPPNLEDEEAEKKAAEEEAKKKEAEEKRLRDVAAKAAAASAAASVPAAAPVAAPSAAPAAAPPVEAAPAPAAVAPAPAPAPPIGKTFECRRAAEFHVDPEEAQITIDGQMIGIADDWDGAGGGKEWVFPGPGDYTVMISAPGFRTEWVRIRVTPSAKREVADVDNELRESE